MSGRPAVESPPRHPGDSLRAITQRSTGGVRWPIIAGLVALTALWGVVVDADVIPLLAPTGNSTVFQASTAAPFAILGIVFGPWVGALFGFCRDTFI